MYSLFVNLLDAAIVLALEEEEGEEIVVLPYIHRKEGGQLEEKMKLWDWMIYYKSILLIDLNIKII